MSTRKNKIKYVCYIIVLVICLLLLILYAINRIDSYFACLADKEYRNNNILNSIVYYTLSAKLNNSSAQNNLGLLYSRHYDLYNCNKSLYYLSKSFSNGDIAASANIGSLLLNCPFIDIEKSYKLYKYSSDKGNPFGQFNLGMMYYYGYFVKQDYKMAYKLFSLSSLSSDENPLAFYAIGKMYEDGKYFSKDALKAQELYGMAAKKGDPVAMLKLAMMNLSEKKYSDGLKYLNNAAKSKDMPIATQAQTLLGSIYEDGQYIEKDNKLAGYWYTQAAKNGNPAAIDKFIAFKMRNCIMNDNQYAKYEYIYRKFIREDKENINFMLNYTRILINRGKIEEANINLLKLTDEYNDIGRSLSEINKQLEEAKSREERGD